MRVRFYVICCFFLVDFNTLSLLLILSLWLPCVVCVLPWVYPAWDSLHFLDLVDSAFSHVRELFSCYFFKYLQVLSLSLSFLSGTSTIQMLMHLTLSRGLLVHFSPVTQSCVTFCDPMNCSMPGLPIHHQLPEFTQTHVHWVGDAIQPSHPLPSPSPPAFNLSQNQGLFKWVSSLHQVAKLLEFQLQHQSFQWTPRTDLL